MARSNHSISQKLTPLTTTSFHDQIVRQHLGGQEPKGFERYVRTKAELEQMHVLGENGDVSYNPQRFMQPGPLEEDFPRR